MLDWAKTGAYNVQSNIFNRKDMTELKKLFASPRDESSSSDADLELNYQESKPKLPRCLPVPGLREK